MNAANLVGEYVVHLPRDDNDDAVVLGKFDTLTEALRFRDDWAVSRATFPGFSAVVIVTARFWVRCGERDYPALATYTEDALLVNAEWLAKRGVGNA